MPALWRGAYFVKARAEGETGSVPWPREAGPFTTRTAEFEHGRPEEEMVRFVQCLVLGEFSDATDVDEDGRAVGYRVWTPDGSLAHVEGGEVRQAGPRRLWDALDHARSWFASQGHPSRDRFGATITPDRQVYWLDEPGNVVPPLIAAS